MRKIFFLLTLVLALTCAKESQASTNVSGNIVSPIWTAENSPYIINGTMEVARGAKLTIQPGVLVKFNQNSKIIVRGELEAIGEENNRIFFTANQASPSRGNWNGIEFTPESASAEFDENGDYKSGSILKYTTIKYSNTITCDQASPYFEKNLILNNNTGITITGTSSEEILNLEKIIINNNEITDNNVGILINRSNKNEYISTPAGRSLKGELVYTSLIKNNNILNNTQGILISNGDNNIIIENNINNNLSMGVIIEAASGDNILEKNSINNNNLGLLIASGYNNILENNIINNTTYGLKVGVSKNIIRNNNIYKNDEANLLNSVAFLDIAHNYWGVEQEEEILESIKNLDPNKKATVKPFQSSIIDIQKLNPPIISDLISTTSGSSYIMNGTKPINTDLYINGDKKEDAHALISWQERIPLELGDNIIKIYLKKDDQESEELEIKIHRQRIITKPTVKYEKEVIGEKYLITGTKDSQTSIWINDKEVITNNSSSKWSHEVPLIMGVNKFRIYAQSEQKIKSTEVTIEITRNDIDKEQFMKDEKKLLTTLDEELTEKLLGKILLQVEANGESWYLYPRDKKRYFMGRARDAFDLMRELGLGIKHDELKKYIETSFPERLAGLILLDVEKNGEAYYIDTDLKSHSLGKPDDAFGLMRELGLGITNENIYKIDIK